MPPAAEYQSRTVCRGCVSQTAIRLAERWKKNRMTSIDNTGNIGVRPMMRRVMAIAVPALISNISVPLLSLVDTAITGHLGSEVYIGAIAVGGLIFNVLYWLMGFIRMGTSGLVSQAYGAHAYRDISVQLVRSLFLGLSIGLALVILSPLVSLVAFDLVGCPASVRPFAVTYFRIGILGGPAVLGMYSFSGWFLGMQNSRFPMYVAVSQNIGNIIASLVLVYCFHLGVAGVAAGTVIGEYSGLLLCLWLWRRSYSRSLPRVPLSRAVTGDGLRRFFSINKDIFLRSLFLVAVMSCFTVVGARLGALPLAANALLMQFFTIFSYVSDALAFASEALSGRYIGASDRADFALMVRVTSGVTAAVALVFFVFYAAGGGAFLSLLTDERATIDCALTFLPFVAMIPIVSAPAFLLDGVYVGATASRLMLYSSMASAAGFFIPLLLFLHSGGNYALWASFLSYLTVRSLAMIVMYPRMKRRAFAIAAETKDC